jgi:hypothetical protein
VKGRNNHGPLPEEVARTIALSDPRPDELALYKLAFSPPGDCPDLAALEMANSNPVIGRHLSACSSCRTELAMLRRFENGEPKAEEAAAVQWIRGELRRRAREFAQPPAVPPPRPPIWAHLGDWIADLLSPRRLALSMAGVSLLLLIGAGIYLRSGSDATAVLNPAISPVWRSEQLAALFPIGDITETPTAFGWESAPGAVKYVVHFSGVDGAELWRGESTGARIEAPRKIRGMMTPGRAFHWKVDAQNAAGETIAATDSQTFHIVPTIR